jgi:hypothetical protein
LKSAHPAPIRLVQAQDCAPTRCAAAVRRKTHSDSGAENPRLLQEGAQSVPEERLYLLSVTCNECFALYKRQQYPPRRCFAAAGFPDKRKCFRGVNEKVNTVNNYFEIVFASEHRLKPAEFYKMVVFLPRSIQFFFHKKYYFEPERIVFFIKGRHSSHG